jgi:hypothetical protein
MVGMLVGCSAFGFLIGEISVVVDAFDPQAMQLAEKMTRVKVRNL